MTVSKVDHSNETNQQKQKLETNSPFAHSISLCLSYEKFLVHFVFEIGYILSGLPLFRKISQDKNKLFASIDSLT